MYSERVLERLPVEGSSNDPQVAPGVVDAPSGGSLGCQSTKVDMQRSSIATPDFSDQVTGSTLSQGPDRPPTPLVTSPTVFGLSNRSLEGVVTVEKARSPRLSKYAGKVSSQVLAKSAEELFQDKEIRIRVMDFYRPLMRFAEEIPMVSSTYRPTIQKPVASQYIEGESIASHSLNT